MLTADTSVSDYLTAEYFLNGKFDKLIKTGSGDAATAASAVANDIVSFDPISQFLEFLLVSLADFMESIKRYH